MKVVKESSDALNPPVVTRATIEPAPRRRTWRDYAALSLATCGVGYMPVAPGTWGSALGVAIFLLFEMFGEAVFPRPASGGRNIGSIDAINTALFSVEKSTLLRTSVLVALSIGITLVGVWASTRAESLLRRKDPGVVVIDEVAGQLLAFLFVPARAPWWIIALSFVAFRLFDIWKPYPIRRLESLESGLGIMADDVLAGAYAATLVLFVLTLIYLLP
ncbi:MAG TPA: phosphatidylglycerophosphatase A [Pyrinomonadaceae bacterium]|jgi:phosphatidylglycerophosphatase A|nr:phosphatidylglycerophosphatase A [Pyrinomonadaceae bacterium]